VALEKAEGRGGVLEEVDWGCGDGGPVSGRAWFLDR
jgi:hypothetical protein